MNNINENILLIKKIYTYSNPNTKVNIKNIFTGITKEYEILVIIGLEKNIDSIYDVKLNFGSIGQELLRGYFDSNTNKINLDTNLIMELNKNQYNINIKGKILFDINNILILNFDGIYNITLNNNSKIYICISVKDKFIKDCI